MQRLVFYEDIIVLALNRIISFPLKLPRSLLVPSHYVASFSSLFFCFVNHDTTNTMDDTTLTPEVVQSLFATITELRTEIAELKASRTPTSSQDDNTNPPPVSKSEKFPDPPMFSGNRKELRPFITKLRLKLERNADRFPTDTDKVSYGISRLEGDAAATIDPSYRNGALTDLETLVKLLEMTYDDVSRKYTALTRLETCRQTNREFTSFYSEFLALMGELNWNEDAKIAALRRAISNEVRSQLVGRDMPPTLAECAALYQRIDEDLRLNQASRYRQSNAQRTPRPTAPIPSNSPAPIHDPMDIDDARTQYAPAGSDERKNRLTKGECFGCGQKGHRHRDCPTNPYNKVRQTAITNLNESAPTRKTYATSVTSSKAPEKRTRSTPLRVATPRVMSPDESENESS